MTTNTNFSTGTSRRSFLSCAAKASVATAAITSGLTNNAFAATSASTEKKLRFFNTHTKESLDVVFFKNGRYDANALHKLNLFLRDHRENEAVVMDRGLFEQLWEMQQRIGGEEVFDIISGYRSPNTNGKLRKTSSGVAKKSYHMRGRAIDIRLRGTKISHVRKVALGMKAGGVGYYPSSNFVHLDTGPVRNWA